MSGAYKQSRYSHIFTHDDGRRLAFNALACGLAEMDDDSYQKMCALCAGVDQEEAGVSDELLRGLKRGGYIVDSELDELDVIRSRHYSARFGGNSFSVTVLPTYHCNFGCDYCYEPSEIHTASRGFMTDEMCDNFVEFCRNGIPKDGQFSVAWYGGEPLLAKKIIGRLTDELREVCEARGTAYRATMVTNGYLLNAENIAFLKEMGVSRIQVTVDGPAHIHNLRRPLRSGGDTYETICSNVDAISEDDGILIGMRINIDRRNAEEMTHLFGDWNRRGWHKKRHLSFNFGQVDNMSGTVGSGIQCMMAEEFSDFIVGAYQTALDYGFRISLFPNARAAFCAATGSKSFVLEPNGNIQACWTAVGKEEQRIGVLTDKGIVPEIPRTRWLGWMPFNEECSECSILPLCVGGCPYKSLYNEGRSKCLWWKYNLEDMLKLAVRALDKGLLNIGRISNSKEDTVEPEHQGAQ